MIDFYHIHASWQYKRAIWISRWHDTRHESLIYISWQMHEAIYISFALSDIYKKKLGIPKTRDMWQYVCNIRSDAYSTDKNVAKYLKQ